jgi:beta-1,4-mannosyltransferase
MNQLVLGLLAVGALWAIYRFSVWLRPTNEHSLRSVAILVLGDVGRSPRMMYHAECFAENGFVTHLIGYKGACGKLITGFKY